MFSSVFGGLLSSPLFAHHVPNDVGVYCVTLHVGSVPCDVIVDDVFPCDVATALPLCCVSTLAGDPLPSVVEKAFAKVHDSYAAVHVLPLTVVLEELFGAPATATKVDPAARDELWKDVLRQGTDKARFICATAKPVKSDTAVQLGHLFVMREARETGGGGGGDDERILRLWSAETGRVLAWKGDWVEGGAKFTPELAAALGEGEMWIGLDEFVQLFEFVTVVHDDAEWRRTSCYMELQTTQSLVQLDLSEPTEVLFTVRQTAGATIGTRLCVVQAARPHKPYGGTDESFVAASVNATNRMTLPEGSFIAMIEVYSKHAARLPVTVELTLETTARKKGVVKKLAQVTFKDNAPAEWAFCLPSFAKKNGSCMACGNALAGTIFTLQGAMKYHDFCFVCTTCHSSLGTAVLVYEGKLYCKSCGPAKS
jgi:hypothetical protein